MNVGVGGEVESKCGRCNDATWHIVLAKVGDDIVKVQCNRCGAQHRYRPPEGTKPKPRAKAERAPRAAGAAKSTSSPRRNARVDAARIEADLDRPVRSYSVKEYYLPGDRIAHPRFGVGVVETMPGAGKIEVFFLDGRRLLAQARAPRTEEQP